MKFDRLSHVTAQLVALRRTVLMLLHPAVERDVRRIEAAYAERDLATVEALAETARTDPRFAQDAAALLALTTPAEVVPLAVHLESLLREKGALRPVAAHRGNPSTVEILAGHADLHRVPASVLLRAMRLVAEADGFEHYDPSFVASTAAFAPLPPDRSALLTKPANLTDEQWEAHCRAFGASADPHPLLMRTLSLTVDEGKDLAAHPEMTLGEWIAHLERDGREIVQDEYGQLHRRRRSAA